MRNKTNDQRVHPGIAIPNGDGAGLALTPIHFAGEISFDRNEVVGKSLATSSLVRMTLTCAAEISVFPVGGSGNDNP
jgi:hypothetical protein